MDTNTILDGAILVLLAAGGYVLNLVKTGAEAAVKTSAEQAAEAVVRQLQWPAELARELEKTRGVERQELRFKSYGLLWKELRPLAIYDLSTLDTRVLQDLSGKLSDWYFSDLGGLFLTPQARGFYFALQELLRLLGHKGDEIKRSGAVGDQARLLRTVLEQHVQDSLAVLDYFEHGEFASWREKAAAFGKIWQVGIPKVVNGWSQLTPEHRFATLQQVGSILRTSLVTDIESRLG